MSKRSIELLKHFPDGKTFLEQFNYDACLDRYGVYLTVSDALKTGKMKLREIASAYNKQTPLSMLELWLVSLSQYMGFEITDQQARETAMYIYEDCHSLNLAEITLLFKNIKKGKYGEFFGAFNGQIVMRACREYKKERGHVLSKLSEEELSLLI